MEPAARQMKKQQEAQRRPEHATPRHSSKSAALPFLLQADSLSRGSRRRSPMAVAGGVDLPVVDLASPDPRAAAASVRQVTSPDPPVPSNFPRRL
jgi:hypothetical protein